eukprot:352210-Chlamydomonas_euryale.AAC.1
MAYPSINPLQLDEFMIREEGRLDEGGTPTFVSQTYTHAHSRTLAHKQALGLAVRSWDQLVAEGADATGLPAPTAPKPADLCTIMYTSGTTGGSRNWGDGEGGSRGVME